MSIITLAKSPSGKTILLATEEGRAITTLGTIDGTNPVKGGRYLVEYGQVPVRKGSKYMIPQKEYFDSKVDAHMFFRFQANQERFVEAKEAGLNDETAELVATGKMTLEAALGDIDLNSECHFIEASEYQNECEDESQGGEDDNTPPLEVIMAGGWAAWEYQNEKNAWLDTRF